MRTAAVLFVLLFAPIVWAESIAIQADGAGSCTYPVPVKPGEMIDATISVDYEQPVTNIRESYPPSVNLLTGGETDERMVPTPVNWETYSAEVVDGKVRIQLEMPPVGDTVTIHQGVTHKQWTGKNDAGNSQLTVNNDPRHITIQLTVTSAEATPATAEAAVQQAPASQTVVLPPQSTDDMGHVWLSEAIPAGSTVMVPVTIGKPHTIPSYLTGPGGVALYCDAGRTPNWGGTIYTDPQFDWGAYSAELSNETITMTWKMPADNWRSLIVTQQVVCNREYLSIRQGETPPYRSQVELGLTSGLLISVHANVE